MIKVDSVLVECDQYGCDSSLRIAIDVVLPQPIPSVEQKARDQGWGLFENWVECPECLAAKWKLRGAEK